MFLQMQHDKGVLEYNLKSKYLNAITMATAKSNCSLIPTAVLRDRLIYL